MKYSCLLVHVFARDIWYVCPANTFVLYYNVTIL